MKFFFLIFFSFLFIGCDIFNVRDAEDPDLPPSNYLPPAFPDDLISNFINSFLDKDVNNYTASFSDKNFTDKIFQFVPSSGAVSQFPLFVDWDKTNEGQYFQNMILKVRENSQITLELTEISRNNFGDSLFYTASYTLTIPFTDAEFPENYQGVLTFKMVRDSRSIWSIYFWQDNKSTNQPSWSELKGRLSN